MPDATAGRILLIDDEPALLRLLGRVLGKAHETLAARDGESALALVRAHGAAIDVVLCDVTVGDTDGITLRDAIAAESPVLAERFTFITAGSLSAAMEARLRASGCPVMEKPLEPTTLLAHVAARVRAVRGG
jgi:DNA-binding NtrC family response regulator